MARPQRRRLSASNSCSINFKSRFDSGLTAIRYWSNSGRDAILTHPRSGCEQAFRYGRNCTHACKGENIHRDESNRIAAMLAGSAHYSYATGPPFTFTIDCKQYFIKLKKCVYNRFISRDEENGALPLLWDVFEALADVEGVEKALDTAISTWSGSSAHAASCSTISGGKGM
jgi:hypothetical protein